MASGGGLSMRRQLDSDDKVDSPNLRDFLRIKEDDNNYNGGRALGSALGGEKRGQPLERVQSNRTLLDIIREEAPGGNNVKDGKRSWKHFREKLRLRSQGSGSSWTSSVPVPTSDVPIHQNSIRMMSRRDSTRTNMPILDGSSNMVVELSAGSGFPRTRSAMFQRNASRAVDRGSMRYDSYSYNEPDDADEEAEGAAGDSTEEEQAEAAAEGEDGEGGGGVGGGGEAQPVRMSLMALLAETDRQMGIDGSTYTMEEEEEEDEKGGGGEYSTCCVCMVRHKGAAFIPCGHTFCRLCSRELWVQRGNCPLCNNFILEILDIF